MEREEFLSVLPELVKEYKPSEKVLRKINNVTLLMIIGPSGSGKTTLIERTGMHYVASDTTRPKRSEEIEEVDYHFRSDYSKLTEDIKKGRFVQVAVGSGGDFYATRDSSYPDTGTAVMAVVADVIPIFRNLGFEKTLSAFIVPPTYEEWQRRMTAHHLTDEQLKKRLLEAERSFSFALTDEQTHMILNDDIEEATKQLQDLLEGRTDTQREEKAKVAAEELLTRLQLVNP